MEKYNGWTNYETWSVALLIDNDQGSQEYWQERAEEAIQEAIDTNELEIKHSASVTLADWLKEEHEENNPLTGRNDVYDQLLSGALSVVDWYEIAQHYVNDVDVWVAGWNLPGYMPDCDPAVFLSFDDAKSYITEELERVADEEGMIRNDQIANRESFAAAEERESVIDDGKTGVKKQKDEFSSVIGKYCYWVTKGE